MRILYGVQATGAGHIARSRILLPELKKVGIDVDFLFSGGKKDEFFDMQVFGNYAYRQGLTLSFADGKVQKLDTILNSKAVGFFQDIKKLDLSAYDLLITDFEPISAWAAKLRHLPSVGLSNQYTLVNKISTVKAPFGLAFGMSTFAPADIYFGIHWQKLASNVIPPLTETLFSDEEILKTPQEDFNMVYLANENLNRVLEFVQNFTKENFVIYTPKVKRQSLLKNAVLKPLSRKGFLDDLLKSKGVICNTGFGLCTEAMQLGKKILTKPLKGQFEQELNARVLENMHRASIIEDFDLNQSALWFEQPDFKPKKFANSAKKIAEWIKNSCDLDAEVLVDQLWNREPKRNNQEVNLSKSIGYI